MIDARQQVDAVSRTAGTRVLAAGEARVSTISQVYRTGLDDLWDVVTSAERIPRWFLPITGDLVEGGRYQLDGNAGGTITECDRPRRYAATWEYNGEVSWIEVRLTPEGDDRTRLELEHVGHVDSDFWDTYGPGAAGVGWDLGLLGLAAHLAGPEHALAPADAPAWIATADGRELLRGAADGWAAADIATGTDEASAQARADRTYTFYAGG